MRGLLTFMRGQLTFMRGQLTFMRGQLTFMRGLLTFRCCEVKYWFNLQTVSKKSFFLSQNVSQGVNLLLRFTEDTGGLGNPPGPKTFDGQNRFQIPVLIGHVRCEVSWQYTP